MRQTWRSERAASTARALRIVIASVAKQSRTLCKRRLDCFATLAMMVTPQPSPIGSGEFSALADLPESQIRRMAAFAFGFASVSRHRVIGPWQAPVGDALRGPDEIARA